MADLFGNFRLAIDDPNYFFGRGELISEVKTSPFEVRILLGGRRLGKTSLLNAICWTLLETEGHELNRALPVLFNLQQEQPKDLDHFRYLLIARLQETIESPQLEHHSGFDWHHTYRRFMRQISGGGVSLFGIQLNVTNSVHKQKLIHEDFSQDLVNIIRRLQHHNCYGVCFFLDGAEYIVTQDWANDAWSYLRSLKDTSNIKIQPFLGLFLSGYRELKDYQQQVGSPLLNIAEVKWLTTLTQAETRALIERRCEDEKIKLTAKGINFVVEWAGCHPYLTNQMLNEIFANRHRRKPLSDRDFIRHMIKQHRKRDFEAWWDKEQRSYGFGKLEQSVYLLLVRERQGVAEKLAKQVNLSIGELEDALEVLAGTGVIQQMNYYTYTLGARLFEEWVSQEKS